MEVNSNLVCGKGLSFPRVVTLWSRIPIRGVIFHHTLKKPIWCKLRLLRYKWVGWSSQLKLSRNHYRQYRMWILSKCHHLGPPLLSMKNNCFVVLALLKFIVSFAYLWVQIDVGRFFNFWSIKLKGLGFYDLNLIQHSLCFLVCNHTRIGLCN